MELLTKYPNIKKIRLKKSKINSTKEIIIKKEEIKTAQANITTPIKEEQITENKILTPKDIIKQVNEIITKSEEALQNNNIEDAKKYYIEAKTTYFHSNLDYEYKSKVYKKILELNNKLSKR
jgi:hypothetical protein